MSASTIKRRPLPGDGRTSSKIAVGIVDIATEPSSARSTRVSNAYQVALQKLLLMSKAPADFADWTGVARMPVFCGEVKTIKIVRAILRGVQNMLLQLLGSDLCTDLRFVQTNRKIDLVET